MKSCLSALHLNSTFLLFLNISHSYKTSSQSLQEKYAYTGENPPSSTLCFCPSLHREHQWWGSNHPKCWSFTPEYLLNIQSLFLSLFFFLLHTVYQCNLQIGLCCSQIERPFPLVWVSLFRLLTLDDVPRDSRSQQWLPRQHSPCTPSIDLTYTQRITSPGYLSNQCGSHLWSISRWDCRYPRANSS